MSNTFHPGVTSYTAKILAKQITCLDNINSLTVEQITKAQKETADIIEPALNHHACRAAGIMGNDPSSIYRSVWYRSDGWGHGGSAISWQDRAEELEAEIVVKNDLIDRAKAELEEVLWDQSAEIGGAAVNRITKLLTDIEHL